ncbi:MAG: hypothetical protein V3T54_00315 [Acidobacteriota bacterium]
MTSDDIMDRIEGWHDGRQWSCIRELRVGTGFSGDSMQRIDLWIMNNWPSRGFERIAYEVKVSRGDFLREIKKPWKRKAAMRLSNMFFFAAPLGLLKAREIPEGCGLLEIPMMGRGKVTVPAKFREDQVPEWVFVSTLARRASEAEQDLRAERLESQ